MSDKKMTQDEVVTRMISLAGQKYNCSQILMALFLENEQKENPDLMRAMAGLGDGCGFFHETCGIMTGAASVLGFYAGKGADNEKESKHLLPMLEAFGEWFREETAEKYQGTRCREIVGDLVGTDQGKQICGGLIFQSYTKLNEILTDYNY